MRLADVGPVTEVDVLYAKQLTAAVEACAAEHSPEPLFAFCRQWAEIAPDAADQVNAADFSWEHLRYVMEMERRGRFSGEGAARRFGAILIPTALMDASMVAMQFGVPVGLALNRLVEHGALVMVNGGLRRAEAREQEAR